MMSICSPRLKSYQALTLLAGLVVATYLCSGCRNSHTSEAAIAANFSAMYHKAKATAHQAATQKADLLQASAQQIALARTALAQDAKGRNNAPPQGPSPFGPLQDSGEPGLVVCEPVAQGADATTAAFGAGCGRWLHLSVAGLPEVGKTPLWGGIDDVRQEWGKPNLRLTLADALKLANTLGVTHVAVGQVQGNLAHCTLQYQLYQVPAGKAVGSPLVVQGSPAQIVAGLPGMARIMAARLGVPTLHVPTAVGANASELGFLGQVPWKARRPVTAQQKQQLQALAHRLPLAGLLYQRSEAIPDDAAWKPVVKDMMTQAPQNAIVVGDIGWLGVRMLYPYYSIFTQDLKQFPHNYLLATANACWYRCQKSPSATTAATFAMSCSPRNPHSWLMLSWVLADAAEKVRQSRYGNQISQKEWAYLNKIYGQWFYAATQITRLNPRNDTGWLELATAGTFADQPAMADSAFWKALAVNKDNTQVYSWGLQMYQSKWGGNPQTLLQVAELAAADDKLFKALANDIISALEENGQHGDATRMLNKAAQEFQADARDHPNDADAHARLADFIIKHTEDHCKDDLAIQEFQALIRLRPRDAEAYFELGNILHYRKHFTPAEKLYRQALAISPNYADANNRLADLYFFVKHDIPGADKLYRKAVAVDPQDGLYRANLAQCLLAENNRAAALVEAQKAISLDYLGPHAVFDKLGLQPGNGSSQSNQSGQSGQPAVPAI